MLLIILSSVLIMEGMSILPPGFRFHPTDEELITFYLKEKVSSSTNPIISIIADIDLYKFNPWELPDKALFGEKEWFFFSPRDRKYPNGARPNRSAASGYWKATGTDKPILSQASCCVGVKKALVFYGGRARNGTKTNWMMHEYRLLNDAHYSLMHKGSMRLDDWVLCRVRLKTGNAEPITRRSEDAKSRGKRSFSSDSDGFGEEEIVEKISYFQENLWHPQQENASKAIVVDTDAHLDHEAASWTTTSDNSIISNGNNYFESSDHHHQAVTFMNPNSMNDALESVKRVLSLGALDEQSPKEPNKRLRTSLMNSSGSNFLENPCIFQIS